MSRSRIRWTRRSRREHLKVIRVAEKRGVLSFFRRLLAMGKPPRTKRAPAVTRERQKADAILAELRKARASS